MQAKLKELKASLARYKKMLDEEDALATMDRQDHKSRKQYLSGRISGLEEAIRLLEASEKEKSHENLG